MKVFTLCLALVLCAGCELPERSKSSTPSFADWYALALEAPRSVGEVEAREARVTLSVEGLPLNAFLRALANETGISVVAAAELDQLPVSIDVADQPASVVVGLVARRLGVEATRSGDAFFLGALKAEDRGVLVRRVGRLDADQLALVATAPLSSEGRLAAFADGTLVVSDRVEVLQRLVEVLDSLEAQSVGDWCVQLWVVGFSDLEAREFGLDIVPAVELSAGFALASNGGNASSHEISAGLTAALTAAGQRDRVDLVAEPLFLLADGERARVSDVQRDPIPQTTTSPEGTSFTSGVEFVETGLSVACAIRETGRGGVLLDVDVELSEVLGFLDEFPRISSREFSTRASLANGGTYLLGALEQSTASDSLRGVFSASVSESASDRRLWVWARVIRVSGGVADTRARPGTGRGSPSSAAPGVPVDRWAELLRGAPAESETDQ